MGLQYLEESRGIATLKAALVLDAKSGCLEIYLNARCLPTPCGTLLGFPAAQGSGPIPSHLENTSKVIRPKKQDSQVVALAGFSDIIETTHREAHINRSMVTCQGSTRSELP